MNYSLRNAFLLFVDVTLGFLIVCVLPFAWILKDGLGSDMVPATGISALWKFFMTFYVGAAVLLFGSFDLLLRRVGDQDQDLVTSKKASIVSWVAAIIAVTALSLILVNSVFRP